MRNGIRLLLVLSLAFSSAGCTSLVSVSRPVATNPVATATRLVEAGLPGVVAMSTALNAQSASKLVSDATATRAPIVLASALELDERGLEVNGPRQRDLNFAKAQKQAIANIEQQRRTIDEPMERVIPNVCPEVTSTGSIANAAVGHMSTCGFRSELSMETAAQGEDYRPECKTSEPYRSGGPFKFATIVLLVLGSTTLPLARLYREPVPVESITKSSEVKHESRFDSEQLKPSMMESTPERTQFSALCVSSWDDVDLFSNCAMIDSSFTEWSLVAEVEIDSQKKNNTSHAIILYCKELTQPRVYERRENRPRSRDLILYRQARVSAKGPTSLLPYYRSEDSISQCTGLSLRSEADCIVSKGSSAGELIESQNRQIRSGRGMQGIVVFFTEDNEVASVRRVLIVESCSINEAFELTAKVVSVA